MLRQLCERFVKSCEARGLARNTIDHYQSDILKFNAYLCEKEFDSVEQITPEVVEDYLAEKRALVAKSTLRTNYMSIRTFFGFLHKRGFIITNPFAYVVKPKQGKHATRIFNEVEIDKILGACDKSTFTGLRNYATFCLMLATGVRVSELCNLIIEDIDWANNWILVRGKGDKDRIIPMGYKARNVLAAYVKARRKYVIEHYLPIIPNLFISRTGKAMNKDEIHNIIIDIKRRVGGTGLRFSCHTIRHTFATNFLKNGGDIVSLQKVLGHSRIETTKLYINLSRNDIVEQMQKFNPLDNKSCYKL